MYYKLLFLLLFTKMAFSGPWMTGPLLAPAGKTVPAGHVNFEPYGFYTVYADNFRNVEGLPILTVGLTDFMDVQTSMPFDYSWVDGHHSGGKGDYSLALGFQILRQKEDSILPDLRFVVQEVFPTGRFDRLNAAKRGTDQTGLGAYQTFIGFNFQKLTAFSHDHYLRSRLSLVGDFPSNVKVHGVNTFGGVLSTTGVVSPGNSYSVDFALEYSLTTHWVPVFEVLLVHSESSDFSGNPGFTPGGTTASIGGGAGKSASFAPALEYNISANLGIIGGVWFSVTGPHGAKFISAAMAINYYV